jgi:hypothetical protein
LINVPEDLRSFKNFVSLGFIKKASLRGTKTTDRRELINIYKNQIIIINNPQFAGPLGIVRDCFVPRNDDFKQHFNLTASQPTPSQPF